jgi:hypothetical protein
MSGWFSPQSTLQRGCFILYVNAPGPVFPFPKPPPALSQGVVSRPSCSHEEAWHRREGMAQHFPRRPLSGGSAGCHGWSPLEVSLSHHLAPSFSRLRQCHAQRCMRAYEMIVGSPPLQMGQQVWRLLRSGPGTASERCSAMSDRHIHSLDERRVQPSRET